MKLKWLDRYTIVAPHLVLCTNKEMYKAACTHLEDEWPTEWIKPHMNACMHTYVKEGKVTCIVCLDIEQAVKQDSVVVIGMLIHEATHVYQALINSIGEQNPGDEFAAYSIQCITQQLLWDYQRQRDERAKRNKKAHA